jgi:hypothetical protein
MSIAGRCQWCGATYRVDSSQSGDLIDCPSCGSQTRVGDAPEAPQEQGRSPAVEIFRTRLKEERYGRGEPVDRGLDEPEEDLGDSLGRAAGTGAKLLFRGIAVIVIGFLLWHLWQVRQGQAPPAPPAQQARREAAPRQPRQPVVVNRPHQPAVVDQPAPAKFGAAVPPDAARDLQPRWNLAVDPPLEEAALPPGHKIQIPIPEGPSPEITFPATPGSVVCVGNVGNGREYREFWDLRTVQRLGSTRGLKTMFENLDGDFRVISAISPDGSYFVTQGQGPLDLVVWDIHGAKPLGVLPLKREPTAGLVWGAFAGRASLVACGSGVPMQVLAVPASSQKDLERFPSEREYDRHSLALSPGGRFLAVIHNLPNGKIIKVFDLQTGSPSGWIAVPNIAAPGTQVQGSLAFSADGAELAALFEGPFFAQLLCWSVADRSLVEQIDFGGSVRGILQATVPYLNKPLDWFPDRRRWLVCGQGIVDRSSRKLAAVIPEDPTFKPGAIRRVVSDDGIVGVVKDGTRYALGKVPVPTPNADAP